MIGMQPTHSQSAVTYSPTHTTLLAHELFIALCSVEHMVLQEPMLNQRN